MFHRNAGRIILNNYYLAAEIPDAEGTMTCSAIDLNDYVTACDGTPPTFLCPLPPPPAPPKKPAASPFLSRIPRHTP